MATEPVNQNVVAIETEEPSEEHNGIVEPQQQTTEQVEEPALTCGIFKNSGATTLLSISFYENSYMSVTSMKEIPKNGAQLRSLMHNSIDFHYFKEDYGQKKSELLERARNGMVHAIIRRILEFSMERQILVPEFVNLAAAIIELFPEENVNAYYRRSSQGEKPSGKLYSVYTNWRYDLGKLKIITVNSYTKRQSQAILQPVDEKVLSEMVASNDQVKKDQFWTDTLTTRRSEAKESFSNYSTKFQAFIGNISYVSASNLFRNILLSFNSSFLRIVKKISFLQENLFYMLQVKVFLIKKRFA